MGGPGSGLWHRWDRRRVIDNVDCLDVRKLARQGALREGAHAIITWRKGQQSESSMSYSCHGRAIWLEYRTRSGSPHWYQVRQEIALEWLPQKLGGQRAWLRCSDCQRRVALMYNSGRLGYVCRLCTGLPYKSECEMLEDRLYRRMQKLWRRLGVVNGNMHQSVWHHPKPTGMHQATYAHLGELAEEARMQWLHARHMRLAKWLSRYVPVELI